MPRMRKVPLDPFSRLDPENRLTIAFSSITSPPGSIISVVELGQYFHTNMMMIITTVVTDVAMIAAFFILTEL